MFDVRYTSPVDADDALAGSDRIEAHSAVGAGMEVASIAGVQYGDTLLTGSLAAQAIQISLQDPSDLTGATHEFDYLINSINERYHLGYDAYNLFYEAMADGQVSYDAASGAFSNRVSWYIDADHHMVAGDNGLPYRFATQREIDAIATGSADAQTQERIDRARAAGATAVCETYLYIATCPTSTRAATSRSTTSTSPSRPISIRTAKPFISRFPQTPYRRCAPISRSMPTVEQPCRSTARTP